MSEKKEELAQKENYAVSLELEIISTQDQMCNKTDETHIIFLRDYLANLNYQLNCINADIYLLRQKIKKSENELKFQLN